MSLDFPGMAGQHPAAVSSHPPHTYLTAESDGFPTCLRDIPSAPSGLYLRGDPQLLAWEPKVAVIGSRHPSEYGRRVVRQLTAELAQAGVCVVSGLALGIDGLAHQAALEVGGKTIAVLGTPIDQLSPASNRALGEAVIAQGLVVSEYGPKVGTQSWQFAARNRLISGLARAVVIVEAGLKSGTLITTQYALQQGREVFALPGPVDAATSAGTLQLIRDGARCVRSAADVLADLGLTPQIRPVTDTVTPQNYRKKRHPLLDCLAADPVHMDNLLEKSGLTPAALSQTLLELELAGQVRKLPGHYYVKGA